MGRVGKGIVMRRVMIFVLLFVFVFFISPLVGALMGAFSGWVVGLFFDETILGIFAQIGIKNVTMWRIGCFIGFVGGFFKQAFYLFHHSN